MALNLCQCVTAVICVWGMFEIVMPSPAMTSGSRQKRQDANMSASDNHTESIEDKHCYTKDDRGQSYAGKVNVTRRNKKCLPWSEVTNCPYHSYEVNHFNTLLEENFCRNPSYFSSTKPWCYTERGNCVRDVCDIDVCASESTISCGPPPAVSDGELARAPKANYSVGDGVTYNCKLWSNWGFRYCLSSGNWSELGFACGVCPNLWTLFQGKCYREFKYDYNFDGAQQFCQRYGAEIASPKSEEENVFLKNFFNVNEFWIGLTQETTWHKFDGQPIEFKRWGKGYPYVKNNELCAVMTSSAQWKDAFCREKKAFVCTVGNNLAKGDAPCLDFSESCPLYFKDNGNLCVEFPNLAFAQCRYTCGLCDIGATPKCAVEAPGDNAIIINGSSSDDISRGETVTYACQEGFEPLHGDIVRGCGASGKLVGTPLECSPGCKKGWTFLRETQSCYKYIETPQDYFTARLFCKSQGGNLATPKTPEQNAFVDEIRIANNASDSDLWIGMNDLAKPGTFRWDDDERVIFSRWAKNAPSKQTEDNCGSMSEGSNWIDRYCEFNVHFVCQVPRNNTSANINELKPCPTGWKLNNGICYNLAAKALNYHDSRKVCEFKDALIAMPKNEEEHNFLVDNFGKKIWLGVNDIDEEELWVFEDGRPVSYFQRWKNNNQPPRNEDKNCLTLDNNANWIAVACDIKRQLVCQKPAQDVGESGNAGLDPPVGGSGNAGLDPPVGGSGNAGLDPPVGESGNAGLDPPVGESGNAGLDPPVGA